MILMGKLTTLDREITQYLTGGYPFNSFQKEWNGIAMQFRTAIADSRPALIITEPPDVSRKALQHGRHGTLPREIPRTPSSHNVHQQAIELSDSDEEQCKPEPISFSGRKRGNAEMNGSPFSSPRKVPRMVDIPAFVTAKGKTLSCSSDEFIDLLCLGLAKKFTLTEIQDIIQDAHVAGIPNQVDPKVVERMSQLSVKHWERPMNDFLQTTGDMLRKLILEQLDDAFGAWRQTALYAEATTIVNEFLDIALGAQREAACRVYNLEHYKPITYNGAALEDAKQKALVIIQGRRRDARISKYLDEQEVKTGRPTTGVERQKKMASVTDAQLGVDPYHQEVDVMGVCQSLPLILSIPLTTDG